MDVKKLIELKLAEYRARYTGKDPFGPWSDLNNLYSSLDEEGKKVMDEVLREKADDEFWRDFIRLFQGQKQ